MLTHSFCTVCVCVCVCVCVVTPPDTPVPPSAPTASDVPQLPQTSNNACAVRTGMWEDQKDPWKSRKQFCVLKKGSAWTWCQNVFTQRFKQTRSVMPRLLKNNNVRVALIDQHASFWPLWAASVRDYWVHKRYANFPGFSVGLAPLCALRQHFISEASSCSSDLILFQSLFSPPSCHSHTHFFFFNWRWMNKLCLRGLSSLIPVEEPTAVLVGSFLKNFFIGL